MKQILTFLAFAATLQLCLAHTVIYPCPPFGISRLPHSTACDKYIQCFAGVAVEQECGRNLHYNVVAEKCTDILTAECYSTQCPLFNDPANLVYLPDYLDCGKYYLCHDNEPKPFRCADGYHWNEELEFCATPAEAACVDYEINCLPGIIHNVPNPRFCNQYYFCLRGESFPAACPGDLLFDFVSSQCNYRGDAQCYEGSITP